MSLHCCVRDMDAVLWGQRFRDSALSPAKHVHTYVRRNERQVTLMDTRRHSNGDGDVNSYVRSTVLQMWYWISCRFHEFRTTCGTKLHAYSFCNNNAITVEHVLNGACKERNSVSGGKLSQPRGSLNLNFQVPTLNRTFRQKKKISGSLRFRYISRVHCTRSSLAFRGELGSNTLRKKGKAVPLQAWSGPEGSRKLRFPDFMTTAQDGGNVVILTYRPPLSPGNTPGTHFC